PGEHMTDGGGKAGRDEDPSRTDHGQSGQHKNGRDAPGGVINYLLPILEILDCRRQLKVSRALVGEPRAHLDVGVARYPMARNIASAAPMIRKFVYCQLLALTYNSKPRKPTKRGSANKTSRAAPRPICAGL